MTIEALKYISDTLNYAGIPYEYVEWTSPEVPDIYFIGECTDVEAMNEDGMQQSVMILTGTSYASWLELMEKKEVIESLFPSVGGRIAELSNGSTLMIAYSTSSPTPTDTMDLKRIQVNLMVKEWKVN